MSSDRPKPDSNIPNSDLHRNIASQTISEMREVLLEVAKQKDWVDEDPTPLALRAKAVLDKLDGKGQV